MRRLRLTEAVLDLARQVMDGDEAAARELAQLILEDEADENAARFIDLARRQWVESGNLEIDDDAEVSQSAAGAWVQAWVWVEEDDESALASQPG